MNRTLMFGIAIFLAVVGFALLGGQDSAVQAGGCHGCSGGCWGCSGGCSGGCYGCHGGWGCHGCSGGCHGGRGCHGCSGGCSGGAVDSPSAGVPYRAARAESAVKAEQKPLGFRSVSFSR